MSKTFIDGNNCEGERVRSQRRQMSLGPWHMPDICGREWAGRRIGWHVSDISTGVGQVQATEESFSPHCPLEASMACRSVSALVPLPCLVIRE